MWIWEGDVWILGGDVWIWESRRRQALRCLCLKRERCRVFQCKQEKPPTERLPGSSRQKQLRCQLSAGLVASAKGAPQGSLGIPTATRTDA